MRTFRFNIALSWAWKIQSYQRNHLFHTDLDFKNWKEVDKFAKFKIFPIGR